MTTTKLTPARRRLLEAIRDERIVQFGPYGRPLYRDPTTGFRANVRSDTLDYLVQAQLVVASTQFSRFGGEPRFWRLTEAGRAALEAGQ